jgi:hypothetical protein
MLGRVVDVCAIRLIVAKQDMSLGEGTPDEGLGCAPKVDGTARKLANRSSGGGGASEWLASLYTTPTRLASGSGTVQ